MVTAIVMIKTDVDRIPEIAQEVSDQRWGLVAAIRLPDGTEFPIYQPRHPSPH